MSISQGLSNIIVNQSKSSPQVLWSPNVPNQFAVITSAIYIYELIFQDYSSLEPLQQKSGIFSDFVHELSSLIPSLGPVCDEFPVSSTNASLKSSIAPELHAVGVIPIQQIDPKLTLIGSPAQRDDVGSNHSHQHDYNVHAVSLDVPTTFTWQPGTHPYTFVVGFNTGVALALRFNPSTLPNALSQRSAPLGQQQQETSVPILSCYTTQLDMPTPVASENPTGAQQPSTVEIAPVLITSPISVVSVNPYLPWLLIVGNSRPSSEGSTLHLVDLSHLVFTPLLHHITSPMPYPPHPMASFCQDIVFSLKWFPNHPFHIALACNNKFLRLVDLQQVFPTLFHLEPHYNQQRGANSSAVQHRSDTQPLYNALQTSSQGAVPLHRDTVKTPYKSQSQTPSLYSQWPRASPVSHHFAAFPHYSSTGDWQRYSNHLAMSLSEYVVIDQKRNKGDAATQPTSSSSSSSSQPHPTHPSTTAKHSAPTQHPPTTLFPGASSSSQVNYFPQQQVKWYDSLRISEPYISHLSIHSSGHLIAVLGARDLIYIYDVRIMFVLGHLSPLCVLDCTTQEIIFGTAGAASSSTLVSSSPSITMDQLAMSGSDSSTGARDADGDQDTSFLASENIATSSTIESFTFTHSPAVIDAVRKSPSLFTPPNSLESGHWQSVEKISPMEKAHTTPHQSYRMSKVLLSVSGTKGLCVYDLTSSIRSSLCTLVTAYHSFLYKNPSDIFTAPHHKSSSQSTGPMHMQSTQSSSGIQSLPRTSSSLSSRKTAPGTIITAPQGCEQGAHHQPPTSHVTKAPTGGTHLAFEPVRYHPHRTIILPRSTVPKAQHSKSHPPLSVLSMGVHPGIFSSLQSGITTQQAFPLQTSSPPVRFHQHHDCILILSSFTTNAPDDAQHPRAHGQRRLLQRNFTISFRTIYQHHAPWTFSPMVPIRAFPQQANPLLTNISSFLKSQPSMSSRVSVGVSPYQQQSIQSSAEQQLATPVPAVSSTSSPANKPLTLNRLLLEIVESLFIRLSLTLTQQGDVLRFLVSNLPNASTFLEDPIRSMLDGSHRHPHHSSIQDGTTSQIPPSYIHPQLLTAYQSFHHAIDPFASLLFNSNLFPFESTLPGLPHHVFSTIVHTNAALKQTLSSRQGGILSTVRTTPRSLDLSLQRGHLHSFRQTCEWLLNILQYPFTNLFHPLGVLLTRSLQGYSLDGVGGINHVIILSQLKGVIITRFIVQYAYHLTLLTCVQSHHLYLSLQTLIESGAFVRRAAASHIEHQQGTVPRQQSMYGHMLTLRQGMAPQQQKRLITILTFHCSKGPTDAVNWWVQHHIPTEIHTLTLISNIYAISTLFRRCALQMVSDTGPLTLPSHVLTLANQLSPDINAVIGGGHTNSLVEQLHEYSLKFINGVGAYINTLLSNLGAWRGLSAVFPFTEPTGAYAPSISIPTMSLPSHQHDSSHSTDASISSHQHATVGVTHGSLTIGPSMQITALTSLHIAKAISYAHAVLRFNQPQTVLSTSVVDIAPTSATTTATTTATAMSPGSMLTVSSPLGKLTNTAYHLYRLLSMGAISWAYFLWLAAAQQQQHLSSQTLWQIPSTEPSSSSSSSSGVSLPQLLPPSLLQPSIPIHPSMLEGSPRLRVFGLTAASTPPAYFHSLFPVYIHPARLLCGCITPQAVHELVSSYASSTATYYQPKLPQGAFSLPNSHRSQQQQQQLIDHGMDGSPQSTPDDPLLLASLSQQYTHKRYLALDVIGGWNTEPQLQSLSSSSPPVPSTLPTKDLSNDKQEEQTIVSLFHHSHALALQAITALASLGQHTLAAGLSILFGEISLAVEYSSMTMQSTSPDDNTISGMTGLPQNSIHQDIGAFAQALQQVYNTLGPLASTTSTSEITQQGAVAIQRFFQVALDIITKRQQFTSSSSSDQLFVYTCMELMCALLSLLLSQNVSWKQYVDANYSQKASESWIIDYLRRSSRTHLSSADGLPPLVFFGSTSPHLQRDNSSSSQKTSLSPSLPSYSLAFESYSTLWLVSCLEAFPPQFQCVFAFRYLSDTLLFTTLRQLLHRQATPPRDMPQQLVKSYPLLAHVSAAIGLISVVLSFSPQESQQAHTQLMHTEHNQLSLIPRIYNSFENLMFTGLHCPSVIHQSVCFQCMRVNPLILFATQSTAVYIEAPPVTTSAKPTVMSTAHPFDAKSTSSLTSPLSSGTMAASTTQTLSADAAIPPYYGTGIKAVLMIYLRRLKDYSIQLSALQAASSQSVASPSHSSNYSQSPLFFHMVTPDHVIPRSNIRTDCQCKICISCLLQSSVDRGLDVQTASFIMTYASAVSLLHLDPSQQREGVVFSADTDVGLVTTTNPGILSIKQSVFQAMRSYFSFQTPHAHTHPILPIQLSVIKWTMEAKEVLLQRGFKLLASEQDLERHRVLRTICGSHYKTPPSMHSHCIGCGALYATEVTGDNTPLPSDRGATHDGEQPHGHTYHEYGDHSRKEGPSVSASSSSSPPQQQQQPYAQLLATERANTKKEYGSIRQTLFGNGCPRCGKAWPLCVLCYQPVNVPPVAPSLTSIQSQFSSQSILPPASITASAVYKTAGPPGVLTTTDFCVPPSSTANGGLQTIMTPYRMKLEKSLDALHKEPFVSFLWCVKCNHGGHESHMRDWFTTQTTCPVTDCSCRCVIRSNYSSVQ